MFKTKLKEKKTEHVKIKSWYPLVFSFAAGLSHSGKGHWMLVAEVSRIRMWIPAFQPIPFSQLTLVCIYFV